MWCDLIAAIMFGTTPQLKSLNVEIPSTLQNVRFNHPHQLMEMKNRCILLSNLVEPLKFQNLASEFRHVGATDSKDKCTPCWLS